MKHRKAKPKLNKRLFLFIVLPILAILIAAPAVTYAMFTNSMHARRTIAAYDAIGDRFSSNYLLPVRESRDNFRTVFVTTDAHDPTAVVTVCNYDQGKQTRPNPQTISYSVTARLVRKSGSDFDTADTAYIGVYFGTCTLGLLHYHHVRERFDYTRQHHGFGFLHLFGIAYGR